MSAVAFSADGGFLASGGTDETVALWRARREQRVGDGWSGTARTC